ADTIASSLQSRMFDWSAGQAEWMERIVSKPEPHVSMLYVLLDVGVKLYHTSRCVPVLNEACVHEPLFVAVSGPEAVANGVVAEMEGLPTLTAVAVAHSSLVG